MSVPTQLRVCVVTGGNKGTIRNADLMSIDLSIKELAMPYVEDYIRKMGML